MIAVREALPLAPNVEMLVIVTDGGEARLEVVYNHGSGEEPQRLACVPVPAAALRRVGELLLRAGEQVSG